MEHDFDVKHKSYINKNYFHIIDTPEKAYWVGFLASDGTIVGDEISITLQSCDKEHLEKFSTAINANLKIRTYSCPNNLTDKLYERCVVTTKCKQMCDDLNLLGVHSNKSLNLLPPTNIPDDLIKYWIIGYMDGDGCISKNKKKLRISFTGTYEVLDFIRDRIGSSAVIRLAHRCDNTYQIYIEVDVSLKFLTDNNYINLPFVLERKRKAAKIYSSLI